MGLDIFGFYPHKRVKYGSQTSIHPVDDFGICKAIIAAFNDEVESMEVRIPARK
jgi:hypothetical protein